LIGGRYGGTSARPYVEARLSILSQKLNTEISFVLDTGADTTVLMPLDGAKMGLDYGRLVNTTRSVGIGGYSEDFLEDALVTFRGDDFVLYTYKIKLHISSPSPDIMAIPSLLGRDIINQWALNYDPTAGILSASVRSSDSKIDVSAGKGAGRGPRP